MYLDYDTCVLQIKILHGLFFRIRQSLKKRFSDCIGGEYSKRLEMVDFAEEMAIQPFLQCLAEQDKEKHAEAWQ